MKIRFFFFANLNESICFIGMLRLDRIYPLILTQMRFAHRKGYRMRKLQEKMKLKALKAAEPEPPKRTWLEKIMEKQTKTAITASKIYPPRILSESHLLDEPEDDVFPFDQYKARIYCRNSKISKFFQIPLPANFFYRFEISKFESCH